MNMLVRQLSLFTLAGGVATLFHYAVLVGLVQVAGVGAVHASMIGYACGALVNYALNRAFTFASTRRHREALWRFATIAIAGFGLNAALMWLLVNVAGLYYLVAQAGATLITLAWNFIGNRYWTFAATALTIERRR